MRDVARVKWLSKFDMEPLLSAILMRGMFISAGLIIAGLVVGGLTGQVAVEYRIRAVSIPRFLEADLHRFGSPDFWYCFLVDLGLAVLLTIPFLRLVMTWFYFVSIKRHWIYVICTAIVLLLLGLDMFTDVEFFPMISSVLRWRPFKA